MGDLKSCAANYYSDSCQLLDKVGIGVEGRTGRGGGGGGGGGGDIRTGRYPLPN